MESLVGLYEKEAEGFDYSFLKKGNDVDFLSPPGEFYPIEIEFEKFKWGVRNLIYSAVFVWGRANVFVINDNLKKLSTATLDWDQYYDLVTDYTFLKKLVDYKKIYDAYNGKGWITTGSNKSAGNENGQLQEVINEMKLDKDDLELNYSTLFSFPFPPTNVAELVNRSTQRLGTIKGCLIQFIGVLSIKPGNVICRPLPTGQSITEISDLFSPDFKMIMDDVRLDRIWMLFPNRRRSSTIDTPPPPVVTSTAPPSPPAPVVTSGKGFELIISVDHPSAVEFRRVTALYSPRRDDFGRRVRELARQKEGNMPNPIYLTLQMEQEMGGGGADSDDDSENGLFLEWANYVLEKMGSLDRVNAGMTKDEIYKVINTIKPSAEEEEKFRTDFRLTLSPKKQDLFDKKSPPSTTKAAVAAVVAYPTAGIPPAFGAATVPPLPSGTGAAPIPSTPPLPSSTSVASSTGGDPVGSGAPGGRGGYASGTVAVKRGADEYIENSENKKQLYAPMNVANLQQAPLIIPPSQIIDWVPLVNAIANYQPPSQQPPTQDDEMEEENKVIGSGKTRAMSVSSAQTVSSSKDVKTEEEEMEVTGPGQTREAAMSVSSAQTVSSSKAVKTEEEEMEMAGPGEIRDAAVSVSSAQTVSSNSSGKAVKEEEIDLSDETISPLPLPLPAASLMPGLPFGGDPAIIADTTTALAVIEKEIEKDGLAEYIQEKTNDDRPARDILMEKNKEELKELLSPFYENQRKSEQEINDEINRQDELANNLLASLFNTNNYNPLFTRKGLLDFVMRELDTNKREVLFQKLSDFGREELNTFLLPFYKREKISRVAPYEIDRIYDLYRTESGETGGEDQEEQLKLEDQKEQLKLEDQKEQLQLEDQKEQLKLEDQKEQLQLEDRKRSRGSSTESASASSKRPLPTPSAGAAEVPKKRVSTMVIEDIKPQPDPKRQETSKKQLFTEEMLLDIYNSYANPSASTINDSFTLKGEKRTEFFDKLFKKFVVDITGRSKDKSALPTGLTTANNSTLKDVFDKLKKINSDHYESCLRCVITALLYKR